MGIGCRAVLTMAARMLSQYAAKLWVCGKPDEWVLILRSGEMVRAGIGLKTFKGPFDQVATFPARVHKVDFRTEQVTNEMAGVAVSGMLVWGINRVGTGPRTTLTPPMTRSPLWPPPS